jgi:hypothetical protein
MMSMLLNEKIDGKYKWFLNKNKKKLSQGIFFPQISRIITDVEPQPIQP